MTPESYSTLDELIGTYSERMNRDTINRNRVKKFYNDDESFEKLMQKIIDKDTYRFNKFIERIYNSSATRFPNPWRILYIVLDIVQNDGTEVPPFDTLTRNHESRTMMYHGWTFSWVHGEGTLISIFNKENELVYRF